MNAPTRLPETRRAYRNPRTGEAIRLARPATPRVMPGRRIAECFAACVIVLLLAVALEVMAPAVWAVLVMGLVS